MNEFCEGVIQTQVEALEMAYQSAIDKGAGEEDFLILVLDAHETIGKSLLEAVLSKGMLLHLAQFQDRTTDSGVRAAVFCAVLRDSPVLKTIAQVPEVSKLLATPVPKDQFLALVMSGIEAAGRMLPIPNGGDHG